MSQRKELKAAIAECHPEAAKADKHKVIEALFKANEEYLLTRADEALRTAILDGATSDEDFDKNLILLTRLVNIARVKRKQAANAKAKLESAGQPGSQNPN